jgi:hypothetical protein
MKHRYCCWTRPSDDTTLPSNLKTQATQFVVEKEKPCDDAINDACLDTISISNKVLYYKWTTPHKYSDKKSSINKRVRVTI